MRAVCCVLVLCVGCENDGDGMVSWYGRCRLLSGPVDFEVRDLEPAPEAAVLAGSTGDWSLFNGLTDVRTMSFEESGAETLHAVCQGETDPNMPRAMRCSNQGDPYFPSQALFDIETSRGALILKGRPDNPDNPTSYLGECQFLGERGLFEVSRAPIPPQPECGSDQLECAGACVDANDPMNCGACGNVCEGGCMLGQCDEHRERHRAFALGYSGTCTLIAGDVVCFDPSGTAAATRPYAAGDAIEAAVYDGFLCVVREGAGVECQELQPPSNPLITAPSDWTDVVSLATNGASLAAVTSNGRLLWHQGTGSPVEPRDGVGLVWGSTGLRGSVCWRLIGGDFVCKNLSLEDRVAGPGLDAVYTVELAGAVGIDVNGDVVRWNTASNPPTPLEVFDAVQLSAGSNHFCALTASGQVHCWLAPATGADEPQYLGMSLTQASAIASEGNVGCAKLSDGSVACWPGDDPFASTPVRLDVEGP